MTKFVKYILNDKEYIESVLNRVNQIKKSFHCTICIEYYVDAVTNPSCGHTFCKKCIEDYIGSKRALNCPLCKTTINTRSLRQSNSQNIFSISSKKLEEATNIDQLEKKLKKLNENGASSKLKLEDSILLQKRKRTNSAELVINKKLKSNSSLESNLTKENLKNAINEVALSDKDSELREPKKKVEKWLEHNDARLSNDLLNRNENIKSNIQLKTNALQNSTNTHLDKTNITCVQMNKQTTRNLCNSDVKANFADNENNENLNLNEQIDDPLKFTNITTESTSNNQLKIDTRNKVQTIETNYLVKINDNDAYKNNLESCNEEKINKESSLDLVSNFNENQMNKKLLRKSVKFCKLGKLYFSKIPNVIEKSIQTDPVKTKENSTSTINEQIIEIICKKLDHTYNNSKSDSSEILNLTVIPNSPPISLEPNKKVNEISDTKSLNYNSDTTVMLTASTGHSTTNSSQKTNLINFNNNQFSNLLESSKNDACISKNSKKPRLKKLIPALEFVSECDHLNSFSNPNESLFENGFKTPKSNSLKESYSDSYIINDTPSKSEIYPNEEDISLISKRLSTSAKRMGIINSKLILENSIYRYESSFDKENNLDNTRLKYNESIILENNNATENEITKSPNKFKIQDKQIQNTISKNALGTSKKISDTVPTSDITETVKIITDTVPASDITETVKIITDTVPVSDITETVKIITDTVPVSDLTETVKIITDTVITPAVPETIEKQNIIEIADTIRTIPDTIKQEIMNPDNNKQLINENENQRNNSYLLSSLIDSTNNHQMLPPVLSLAASAYCNVNLKDFNKIPPNANDLLDISYTNNISCNSVSNPNITQLTNFNKNSEIEQKDSKSYEHFRSNSERKFEFVGSLLKPNMKAELKKFSCSINAIISNDITDKTTHLIVDNDSNMLCGVTSKYLKAISRKLWIMSFKWVSKCIEQNEIVDEKNFEIRGDSIFGEHYGPLRSRQSSMRLFEEYEFLFFGKFQNSTIELEDLIQLSIMNGATRVTKAKNFSENNSKIRVIIFDENTQRLSFKEARGLMEAAKINSVNKSWLLDSLACYSTRNMKEYQTYDENKA